VDSLACRHEPFRQVSLQEAQLSQRDCAMLRVIEYFAVTQGNSLSFEMTPSVRRKSLLVTVTMSVTGAVSEIFNVK